MPNGSRLRAIGSLARNLVFAALLYTCMYGTIRLVSDPSARARVGQRLPVVLGGHVAVQPEVVEQSSNGNVKVKIPGTTKTVTLNPHANVFNRPPSAVIPKDDFYGSRPHPDTEADLQLLVEECRGTYEGIEKMRNVFDCLKFFANEEDRYYSLPEQADRASEQDPRKAEYLNADGHGNSMSSYISVGSADTPSKSSLGTCPGPIVPYHVYWSGPATWRVEVFIKSYLYTQNLACSRLWLWVDADRSPNAVESMLNGDPVFARFLPFVERGDIRVMAWKFPEKMPLPKDVDHTDGLGYYSSPGKRNARGETIVGDGIMEDSNGQQWITLTPKQMTFFPQAISDAVRFVILHLHGGLYLDMDVLLLRDMRPLVLPQQHSFAERWAAHSHPGDYNTAIMSLSANSSLSSYLLRGGVRMGLNFHPRVIGRMAWKDGRDRELLMLETAAFDPIWTEFNWDREGRCTVPCLRDYGAVFKGKAGAVKDEWESYDGPQITLVDLDSEEALKPFPQRPRSMLSRLSEALPSISHRRWGKRGVAQHPDSVNAVDIVPVAEPLDSFETTDEELAALKKSGAVADYIVEDDKYAPNNRTLENFFKGAWTYHVHNQWLKTPEPSSWLAVMQSAHDGFFAGARTNVYGEKWTGPDLAPYNRWSELL